MCCSILENNMCISMWNLPKQLHLSERFLKIERLCRNLVDYYSVLSDDYYEIEVSVFCFLINLC